MAERPDLIIDRKIIILKSIFLIHLKRNSPWSSILFRLMLFPLGSCWSPRMPLMLYAPERGSVSWVAGAWAMTETGPPEDDVVPPLVAIWCACFAFSAALFRTILGKKNTRWNISRNVRAHRHWSAEVIDCHFYGRPFNGEFDDVTLLDRRFFFDKISFRLPSIRGVK